MRSIRKLAALCIGVLLALSPAALALAQGLACGPDAVYLDEDGSVLNTRDMPASEDLAEALAYHKGKVLVFVQDGRLLARTNEGLLKNFGILAAGPVWCEDDGNIYYVRTSAPRALMRMDPDKLTGTTCCTSVGDIKGLRVSVNGVLAQIGETEYVYIPLVKRLVKSNSTTLEETILVGDRFDARLDESGVLSTVSKGDSELSPVAHNVTGAAVCEEKIYYLQSWGVGTQLMVYDTNTEKAARLHRFVSGMWDQLAANKKGVLALSKVGEMYFYDLASKQVSTVCSWRGQTRFVPELAQAGDFAVLYNIASGTAIPYFTVNMARMPAVTPRPTPTPTPTPTPRPTLTPVPYITLSRGSQGDAVRRLQERLRDLGYLTGSADGIYGGDTETAVRYLQFDLGLRDTGVADASLQRRAMSRSAPSYQTYVKLTRGQSGIRVTDLQERLRELYYSKAEVDGYYGSSTAQAVERFQGQMGYDMNGDAIKVSQLRALFKSHAEHCDTYYTLRRGDVAPVVKHLNQRLKKLGYLHSTVTETYNHRTEEAIEAFQALAGLSETGVADPVTQIELFDGAAPTPTPTPEPTPMPDSKQSVSNAVVKTMRVWMTNNLGKKYDKESAVEELQNKLVNLGFLDPSHANGVYNEKTEEAVKTFQKANGLSANGKANKKTLAAMFP